MIHRDGTCYISNIQYTLYTYLLYYMRQRKNKEIDGVYTLLRNSQDKCVSLLEFGFGVESI